MLRLQRQPIAKVINTAAFAGDTAVKEVAGIELEAGLGGENGERATSGWLLDSGGE